MSSDGYKNCPFCDEEIKAIAVKCRYCKSILDEESFQEIENHKEEKLLSSNEKELETHKSTDTKICKECGAEHSRMSFYCEDCDFKRFDKIDCNISKDEFKKHSNTKDDLKDNTETSQHLLAKNKINNIYGTEIALTKRILPAIGILAIFLFIIIMVISSISDNEIKEFVEKAINLDLEEGTINYEHGVYSGQLLDGVPYGYGIMEYEDLGLYGEKTYEGEWKDGKRHGQGIRVYSTGCEYIGEWKENSRHGQGIFIRINGKTYEGQWRDGHYHGSGKMIYDNGAIYEGEWKNSKRYGSGTHSYASGNKYEGEWKDDQRHGQGIYYMHAGQFCFAGKTIYSKGDIYEGGFVDDLMHGEGLLTSADGSIKEGLWEYGKYIGIFTKHDRYEGEYKDGKRHGKGILYYEDGTIEYEGEWKDGKKHGVGIKIWANGDTYEGEWKDGQEHGQGKYTWVNGDSYLGDIKNGKFHGQGVYIWSDGDRYEGEFANGEIHGDGVMIYTDGIIKGVHFFHGTFIQETHFELPKETSSAYVKYCIACSAEHFQQGDYCRECTISAKYAKYCVACSTKHFQYGDYCRECAVSVEETTDQMLDNDYPNQVIVDVDVLRLRSGPSTDYSIIVRLEKGTLLRVIGEELDDSNDMWLQVIIPDGKEGWVHSDYVRE